MKYLVILNSDIATCATNDYIISDEDIIKFDSMSGIIEMITEIKNSWESKVEDSTKAGYLKGYDEGLKKGQHDLNAQFLEYLKDLTDNIIVNTTDSDADIINMVCEVTRKIAEDLDSKDVLTSLAVTAIKKLKQHKGIEVKVRPEYRKVLQEKLEKMNIKDNYNYSTLEIVSDPSMGHLDCTIKSDSGVTVASFDEQLMLLKKNIESKLLNT